MYELYADDALDTHGDSDAASRVGAALEPLLAKGLEVWFSPPTQAKGLHLPA